MPLPAARQPFSLIAARIVQESLRPDASLPALGKLAQSDPAFAVRLLGVVNSAAFGLGRRVVDVPQAVTLLGIQRVRTLGLGLAMSEMCPPGEAAAVLLGNALRRAQAARRLAEGAKTLPPEEAFCAGLFLDVALLTQAQSDLAGAVELARRPARDRPVFERVAGLVSHVSAGVEMAKKFHFPSELVLAIERHHDPAPPEGRFALLAWVAERVAAAFEGGDVDRNHAAALDAMAHLGLGRPVAEALLGRLPDDVAAAAQLLSHDVGVQLDLESLARDAKLRLVETNLQYEHAVRRLEELLQEKDALAAELRAANAQLTALAATDGLTGLLNRRAFEDSLRRDLARTARSEAELSLLALDVDHFKQVNDTHGHPAGDEVLRSLGKLLTSTLRTGDVCGRVGGEEFAVVLPNTDLSGARVVAERLRQAVERMPVDTGGRVLRVTVSIGAAAARGSEDPRALLSVADAALYVAKRSGRNRVAVGGEAADRPMAAEPAQAARGAAAIASCAAAEP